MVSKERALSSVFGSNPEYSPQKLQNQRGTAARSVLTIPQNLQIKNIKNSCTIIDNSGTTLGFLNLATLVRLGVQAERATRSSTLVLEQQITCTEKLFKMCIPLIKLSTMMT